MAFRQFTAHLWIAQSEVFATNSGVFLGAGQAGLIDPGLRPEELRRLQAFLSERGVRPRLILITHAHWDHILGPEVFPGVPVAAHARFEEVLRRHGADLQHQIAAWDAEEGRHRERPFALPRPDVLITPPWRCEIGGVSWQAVDAPGHAPDQCAFYQPDAGILWAADMLSDVEIPLVSHSLAAYEATLARIAALDIAALIPGHGTPTASRAEIARRLAADRAYLAALRECVSRVVRSSGDVDAAHRACAALSYAHPQRNRQAHRWNVETVFLELGGTAARPIGWELEWQ